MVHGTMNTKGEEHEHEKADQASYLRPNCRSYFCDVNHRNPLPLLGTGNVRIIVGPLVTIA